MQVESVALDHSEIVEIPGEEWPTFRRHSATNWENLMGESWEPVYVGEEKLEEAYQAFISQEGTP